MRVPAWRTREYDFFIRGKIEDIERYTCISGAIFKHMKFDIAITSYDYTFLVTLLDGNKNIIGSVSFDSVPVGCRVSAWISDNNDVAWKAYVLLILFIIKMNISENA